ncbi:guanine nucleotide-binding protein-like 1 [Babylonia areolata]|uniref:guanine nucleotide-binding protein-like 1 n=1 Tax=Babylonia areolata TaxID=304850 RepID=UPI003FD6AD66
MPRKQAFSGKQKKKQLQERRERKKDSHSIYDEDVVQDISDTTAAKPGEVEAEILHVHEQPTGDKDFDPNRYRLHFLKISQEEMKKRKTAARRPVIKVTEKALEMSIGSVFPTENPLDFPKRPPWDFRLSKTQLERQEQAYYSKYVQTLLMSHDPQRLSYFELNLETWRQLWRVTEISDILLLIADIRYPAVHVPPSLYSYLREELGREVVVVLNKVDMAPPPLVAAWRSYLTAVFPGVRVVCFSSFPDRPEDTASGLHSKQKKRLVKPLGPQELLDICRDLVKDKVNLDSWQEKLDTEDTSTSAPERHGCHGGIDNPDKPSADMLQAGAAEAHLAGVYQRFRDGVLTIGCIGYPNVGKSSLLNGLVGRKVVSVSKTPGHTKHLQTIFLTPTVKLCDCPGLVFPSHVDKSLQIVSGIFPIAQVREPYSTVGYLAQRLDLPTLLHLTHPEMAGKPPSAARSKVVKWSAFDVCESWAVKCGYHTAKASRPDVYRAANQLLRMAVEGRLRLCFAPPDFFDCQDSWKENDFAVSLSERLTSLAHREQSLAQLEDSSSDSEPEELLQPAASRQEEEKSWGEEEEASSCVSQNPFALLGDD